MLRVDLLTRNYGNETNGLSRYDRALFEGLRIKGNIDIRLRGLLPVRNILFDQVRRFNGRDITTFLGSHPLRLPPIDGDLRHITTSAHTTGLMRKTHKPTIVTVHDIIHYVYRRDMRMSTYQHIIQRIADNVAVRNLRNAHAIIASSQFTRQQLIDHAGLKPEQIHVVPLGVDTDTFRPCKVPASFYERYGLSQKAVYVLHVSSEEPRKNIETLLKAWRLVRQSHSDAVLLKVGRCLHPSERPRLLELIAKFGINDSVRFIEAVPEEDLPLFYNAARVFAFPSLAEGFGFPILEAMACGTPVVCSDAPAINELAAGIAQQHPATDASALADQLVGILNKPDERAAHSGYGTERAAQFSWSRTAEQTYSIYEQVLAI